MHDDDRARAPRTASRGIGGREAERFGIGVGQHRCRPAARDGVVQRVADVGRDNDLVARAHVERAQRELERGTAGAHRRRGGDAQELDQVVLQPGDLGSLRQLSPADDARDALGVLVAESRPRVRDHPEIREEIGRHRATRPCLRPPSVQAGLTDPVTIDSAPIAPQRFKRRRIDWKASAYLTRA